MQAPDTAQLVRPVSLDEDDTPAATFVDTVDALDAMVSDILGDYANRSDDDSSDDEAEEGGPGAGRRAACREIAVDLEHHSFRWVVE